MKNLKNVLILFSFMLSIAACSTSKQGDDTASAEEDPAETSAPEAPNGPISYNADSVELKGYMAYDANSSEKRPGILVVHEWWGHNDYARERADMLADLGYVALAVDMYGDGKQAAHPDDAGKFSMSVMSSTEGAKSRFDAAVETLKSHPMVDGEKIGAIGYCFGGSVVLSMANAGEDLDAVAAFHAGLQLPIQPEVDGVKAKVLICNGADDQFIAPEHIEAYKAAMDAANADYTYIAYEGAVHSFTSPDADSLGAAFGLPLAYDAEADKASWDAMQTLFNEAFAN